MIALTGNQEGGRGSHDIMQGSEVLPKSNGRVIAFPCAEEGGWTDLIAHPPIAPS